MRRWLFGFTATLLMLLSLPLSREAAAKEQQESSPGQSPGEPPKTLSDELVPLPTQLTKAQWRSLQGLQAALPPCGPIRPRTKAEFFRNTYNHPLTPREVAIRESIYKLAGHPKQYVHVRLANGKVLTGTIGAATSQAFELKTGILGGSHTVRYAEIAEPPRGVLAVGTRAVKGLEMTGLVLLCIAAVPLWFALYPLIQAGVIPD